MDLSSFAILQMNFCTRSAQTVSGCLCICVCVSESLDEHVLCYVY